MVVVQDCPPETAGLLVFCEGAALRVEGVGEVDSEGIIGREVEELDEFGDRNGDPAMWSRLARSYVAATVRLCGDAYLFPRPHAALAKLWPPSRKVQP